MTTKISTIVDQLDSIASTLYSATRKLLFDPDNIANNDDLYLVKGYGITPSDGENTNRQVGCQFSFQRSFILTLTESVRGTQRDTTSRATAIKNLFEAQYLFINEFENNEQLSTTSPRRLIVGDAGIENVVSEEKKILMLRTNFTVEYFEDLT